MHFIIGIIVLLIMLQFPVFWFFVSIMMTLIAKIALKLGVLAVAVLILLGMMQKDE